jgi:multimeric flavodoxin WrbA
MCHGGEFAGDARSASNRRFARSRRKMKVLIINASPRRKGATSVLLTEVAATVGSTHEVEAVRIHDLDIRPCIGCLKCRPDKVCILPQDDAHVLAEKVRGADFIIIGCPNYWGNMPGALKLFFDRNVPLFEYCEARPVRYVPRPQLRGKRAALVVSSGCPFPYNLLRSQSRGTIGALKTILKAGGVRIEWVLNVPDTFNFERKKERYLKKARRLAASV